MRISFLLPTILVGLFALNNLALAADESSALLLIHDKQFEPNNLTIPAGIKVKIVIRNQDSLPTEFESTELSREVIVPGHGEVTVFVGPLEPGSYQFFNDFNRDMRGVIVVKQGSNKGN